MVDSEREDAKRWRVLEQCVVINWDDAHDEWTLTAPDQDGDLGQVVSGRTLREATDWMARYFDEVPSAEDVGMEAARQAYNLWVGHYLKATLGKL